MRKSEKIYDALSQTDDGIIASCEERYASVRKKKNGKKRALRTALIAAALAATAAVVIGTAVSSRKSPPDVIADPQTGPESTVAEPDDTGEPGLTVTEPDDTGKSDHTVTEDGTGTEPEPEQSQPVLVEDRKPFSFTASYPGLTGNHMSDHANRNGFRVAGLSDVYDKLARAMIGSGMDVVSPVNVYTALSMLAECADGESRAQILDLLGAADMGALREQSKNVWRSLYREDEYGSTVSASSVWLDSGMTVKQNCVEKLLADHYASVSAGDFSSDGYREEIKKWLSDNTRGLLDDQIRGLTFDSNTKAVLSSTLYMKATWESKFGKQKIIGTFNGTKKCGFMQSEIEDTVYFEDGFTAYRRDLGGKAGSVWFFLPDKGNSVQKIIDSGVISYINGKKSEPELCMLDLRIPEFDVCADRDITEALRSLGVTDCFGENADLTNLTDDPLTVSEIRHAARLTADTDGIEGAAYTVIIAPTAADPSGIRKVDLFFDRTFAFAVVDAFDTPVFTGVIDEGSVR
ncbi:MAG: hypothetical protein J6330_02215 [Clostridia bacterium]|nr:hypothetical protein [Clostridia bacterium]